MKNILTLIAALCITSNLLFSAFLGGKISVKHVTDYSYEIDITVCKTNSPWDSVEVVFGDGTTGFIQLIATYPGNNYSIYQYNGFHSFPGSGTYSVFCSLNTWDSNYSNIQYSLSVPLTLETIIHTDPLMSFNSNPVFTNDIYVDTAFTDQIYIYNPSSYDAEGDSLSYEVTSCFGIPSYFFPDTFPYFFVDGYTGDIVWNTPQIVGKWAVAYNVEEWRNGCKISQINKQMTIVVVDNASAETGIADYKINIYPNPTTGKIIIDEKNIHKVFVFNERGEMLINSDNTNEIDFINFPQGVYFIKVLTDKREYIEKIIFE